MTGGDAKALTTSPTGVPWLFSILAPSPDAPIAVREGEQPAAGYHPYESFALVPSAARPQFLVPLVTPQAASAVVLRYNALRASRRRRIERFVVGWALRSPMGRRWLRDQVHVDVRDNVAQQAIALEYLVDHLRAELGSGDLTFAVGLQGVGPFRKPVLQLYSRKGRPIGFAKVAWNALTSEMVEAEADVLERFGRLRVTAVQTPSLLWRGEWHGWPVAVSAPLPDRVRRVPMRLLPGTDALDAIFGMDETEESELGSSRYWETLRGLVASCDDEAIAAEFTRVGERFGDIRLRFGRWHGDWVSWNLATDGRHLFTWDWEFSGPLRPAGFDVLQYYFQEAFIARSDDADVAVAEARALGTPHLAQLGVHGPALRATGALHELEILVRYRRATVLGSDPYPRFDLTPGSGR